MTPSTPGLSPGDTLGTFVLLVKLGEGGMGVVWKARNTLTGRVCALKILRDEAPTADTLARFEREVRLASTVEHPNVVRVFDPFLSDGRLVLPMEYVDGLSLQKRLRPDKGPPVRLSVQVALDVMIPLCAGVSAIHARGIVHRDLKPANVMLARGPAGEVVPKIMDFGIAKAIEPGDDGSDITQEGFAPGSVRYMAPEQVLTPKSIDGRADVYALGVIAYELLTGSRPIEESSRDLTLAVLVSNAPIPSLRSRVPEIPEAVDAVIMKALARERADRFHDVAGFATALEAAGASVTDRTGLLHDLGPISAIPPPGPDGDTLGAIAVAARPTRPIRRARTLLAASVVFTSVLLAWAITRAPSPTLTTRPAARVVAPVPNPAVRVVAPVPDPGPTPVPPAVTAPVAQLLVAPLAQPAPTAPTPTPPVARPHRPRRNHRVSPQARPHATSTSAPASSVDRIPPLSL